MPFGLLEFLQMPFGHRNAVQTFQHFIDQVLRGLHFCYAYIDGILIASASLQEHQEHLHLVFQSFHHHGVVINPNKCQFEASSLQFLGHQINSVSIRPLNHKVQVILDFPVPTTHHKLREFLGLVMFTIGLSHTHLTSCTPSMSCCPV